METTPKVINPQDEPSSDSQWVVIAITNNSTSTPVMIKNLRLLWGMLHKDGHKNAEIPVGDIENQVIQPGSELRISSCGRDYTGTEGEFDVLELGGPKVRHFYWDCPAYKTANDWRISEPNKKWIVESHGANMRGGALGNISVDLHLKA